MVCFDKYIAVFVFDILAGKTSCDTLLEALDLFVAVHECAHIHSRNLLSRLHTVGVVDDQFLRYIDKTSCQVSGVSSTQSRIGQTFTGSVGGHEVFQYVQTFTEV